MKTPTAATFTSSLSANYFDLGDRNLSQRAIYELQRIYAPDVAAHSDAVCFDSIGNGMWQNLGFADSKHTRF